MQLLRLGDVPVTERDRVFRAPPFTLAVVTAAVVAGALALCVFGWRERAWPLFVAGVLLSGVFLFRGFVSARFRPSNWLVRAGESGVYVQFRSHLNHHLPADDLTVVRLSPGEIRGVRRVDERRMTPQSPAGRGSVVEERVTRVEIETGSDTSGLDAALRAERSRHGPRVRRWFGTSSMVYRHYPVRVPAPGRIEIEWRVAPAPERFFAALAPHVPIGERVKVTKDLSGTVAAGTAELESQLLELAEQGRTIEAVKLARRLYGYDLTEARRFVDGLLGRDRGPATGTDGPGVR